MTRLVTVLLTTLLLAACGDPSGTDVYDLDQQHFSKHMAKVLVDSGKFPPQMQSQLATMLLDTVFNLKLYPDNSFSVHQKQGPEQRSYTGT